MVMARLLRQRLNDYVNQVNRAEADYTQAATAYNSALQGAMRGTTSVITDANGKQVVVGGKTPDGQLALKSSSIKDLKDLNDRDGPSETWNGMLNGTFRYARDADGNVARYKLEPYVETVPAKPGGTSLFDFMNKSKATTVSGSRWVKQGENLPIIPNEPVVQEVKEPNLTRSNIKELQSPSSDQAGMALQQAYGLQAKSALAGDVDNSKVSAFADPEDPNNLAERGILARTLAGQLG